MTDVGHDSPESAAMTGFPPAHCRVIASRVLGEHAYVLLNTGSPGRPYLYGVNCARKAGRWFEGGSGNGPGWAQIGDDPELGTLSVWGEAPEGAEAVRFAFNDRPVDEAVVEGACLVVWWNVPCPFESWPHIVAFRTDGVWRSCEL